MLLVQYQQISNFISLLLRSNFSIKLLVIILPILLFSKSNIAQTQNNSTIQSNNNIDTSKINHLLLRAKKFWLIADTLNAKTFADSAYNLSVQMNDDYNFIESSSFLGVYYNRKGNYRLAFEYSLQALKKAEKIKDPSSISRELGNLGNIYSSIGNLPNAVDHYLRAQKIAEENDLKYNSAVQYTNLGYIQDKQGNFTKALEYFKKAKVIADAIKENDLNQTLLGNIGYIYSKIGEHQRAFEYYEHAMNVAKSLNDKQTIAALHSHYGNSYTRQKLYNKAINSYLEALEIFLILGDQYGIAQSYLNIGIVHYNTLNYHKAKVSLEQALSKAEEINSFSIMEMANKALSEIYRSQNKDGLALDYYVKAMVSRDSLNKLEKSSEITRIELNHEFEEKEYILKVKHEQELAVENEKRKNQRLIWLAAFSCFALLAVIGFYTYRKRQLYIFDLNVAELRQKALNAQMSDHFISNTMDSINRFIQSNEREKASAYLILFSRLIRDVLQNSFQRSVSLTDDLAILNKYIELEKLRFPDQKLEYQVSISETIEPDDTAVPPMVLQVLAENSIKHGFTKLKGGLIKIDISAIENKLKIIVQDNGVGRKINGDQNPTSGRKSIGSNLASELILTFGKLNGKSSMEIEDLVDNQNQALGTKIIITLPLISCN